MDESGIEQGAWVLPSGSWERQDASGDFSLVRCGRGTPVSAALPTLDGARLAGARRFNGADYPPEFDFEPDTGRPLPRSTSSAARDWMPPFDHVPGDAIRGLRITNGALSLSRDADQDETSDPDCKRPLPAAGRYEFMGIHTPGGDAMLLAICPAQGSVSVWLPASEQWRTLAQLDDGILADASVRQEHWRCEIIRASDGSARIFVPTHNGIACIEPDPFRLGYHVGYVGDGSCEGSPMLWRDEVWAVLRSPDGALRLQSATAQAQASQLLEIFDAPADEMFATPVATKRNVIWPGERGQLTLDIQADGSPVGRYRPWPPGVSPRFAFGSAFQSADGGLWQACWSEVDDTYVHIRLDSRTHELQAATAPRTSTGRTNYRLGTRLKLAPWIEPEHGNDAESRAIFVPLVESAADTAVLGLRVEAAYGLEALLASADRVRAVLELHSERHAEIRLYVVNVSAPWAGRMFIHDRTLWFYHPELPQILGWTLLA